MLKNSKTFKFLIGTFAFALMLTASVVFAADYGTTTLKVGSRGDAVAAVQTLVGATADGVFGPMTAAKVKAWQASNGLVADGVFGPASRAKANASPVATGCPAGALFNPSTGQPCGTTTTVSGCTAGALFSSTTGQACGTVIPGTPTGLTGGAGTIASTTLLSTYSAEEINEGEAGKVLAFDVKADNGSDLNLSSVKLTFTHANTGSTRIERYMGEVEIYSGSTKVGSADVADFTKNSDNSYSKSISLAGVVVKAGQKVTLSVGVTANTTIDSVDQDSGNKNWTVDLDNIRYNDATGAILTETYTTGAVDKTFGFSDIISSGDLELKLTEGSANPVAKVVEVSTTSATTDVPMLSFNLKATGADMTVTDLAFDLTAVGVDDISEIASDYELFKGATSIASYDSSVSEVAGLTGTLQFTDINDLVLAAGSTTTFTIKAKILEVTAGSGTDTVFDEGDTLKVDFTNANLIDTTCNSSLCTVIEDDNGDVVAAGDRAGAVTGNAQSFYAEGVVVSLVSTSATKTVSPDTATTTDSGTFVINFNVTAVGDDMYIDKDSLFDTTIASWPTGAKQGVVWNIWKAGAAVNQADTNYATSPASILTADGATTGDTSTDFKVAEGTTRQFHLSATVSLDTTGQNGDGYYRVQLGSINWDDANDTGANFYTINLTDFHTADLLLSDYAL